MRLTACERCVHCEVLIGYAGNDLYCKKRKKWDIDEEEGILCLIDCKGFEERPPREV